MTILSESLKKFWSFFFQNDLNEVIWEWNVHRIRTTRNSISPTGRPCMMFEIPSLFHVENYLNNVPSHALNGFSSECIMLKYPCDEDFYHLCEIVRNENNLSKPDDALLAVDFYISMRNILRQILI